MYMFVNKHYMNLAYETSIWTAYYLMTFVVIKKSFRIFQ